MLYIKNKSTGAPKINDRLQLLVSDCLSPCTGWSLTCDSDGGEPGITRAQCALVYSAGSSAPGHVCRSLHDTDDLNSRVCRSCQWALVVRTITRK